MRIVVREFDLMARYGVTLSVEDDETGGGGSLVYTANEPLLWRMAIDQAIGLTINGGVFSVNTGALAIASISHSPVITPEAQGRCDILLLYGRQIALLEIPTKQDGRILATGRRARGCAIAAGDCAYSSDGVGNIRLMVSSRIY